MKTENQPIVETFDPNKKFCSNDIVQWAFYATLVAGGNQDAMVHNAGEPITVELTLNGVHARFSEVVKRFGDQFDEEVEKRAIQLLQERHGDLTEKFDDLIRTLKSKIGDEDDR